MSDVEDNREQVAEQVDAAMEAEREERIAEEAKAAADAEAEREAAQAEADAAMEAERQERIAEEEASKAAAKAAEEKAREEATAKAEAAAEQARKEAESKEAPAEPTPSAKAAKKAFATSESLQESLARLTDEKNDINYVMITVKGKRGTKLKIAHEGTGGFAEMLSKLKDSEVYFIGIKVTAVDERSVNSTRTRFVVATYIGKKAPMMRKAGASTIKATLTSAWNGISIYYNVVDLESFTTEDLKDRLLQCGGAHKPSYYDFGDGTRISLGFYDEHAHGGA